MTLRFRSLTVLSLLALALPLATPAVAQAKSGWTKVSSKGGLTIYNRDRPGSDVKEVKGVGVIDAPAWVCKNVVDDVAEYKNFMPYTGASDLIKRVSASEVVTYQRVNAPLISDRDYTIRIRDLSQKRPDGTVVYKSAWTPANKLGPKAKSGVVRIAINEGYWEFTPTADGKKTRAVYYVYTDPGGSLPSFVINGANQQAVPGLFEAVEKTARKAKYRASKPALPTPTPDAPAIAPPAKSAGQ